MEPNKLKKEKLFKNINHKDNLSISLLLNSLKFLCQTYAISLQVYIRQLSIACFKSCNTIFYYHYEAITKLKLGSVKNLLPCLAIEISCLKCCAFFTRNPIRITGNSSSNALMVFAYSYLLVLSLRSRVQGKQVFYLVPCRRLLALSLWFRYLHFFPIQFAFCLLSS